MAGKTYEKTVIVDGDDDQTITFEVGLAWYDDPGRTWGDPEMCYPPEFHKVDEELLEIYVCGVQVHGEMLTAITEHFDMEWVFEQAWEKI